VELIIGVGLRGARLKSLLRLRTKFHKVGWEEASDLVKILSISVRLPCEGMPPRILAWEFGTNFLCILLVATELLFDA
jgi:hypothetical protein